MIKNYFLGIILLTSVNQAGILLESFNHAINSNHNMKIAHAQLDYENASSYYSEQKDNFKFVADGFARYYTPQKSSLSNANFNLPSKTVYERFTKANLNIVLRKNLINPANQALQALGKEKVKKASYHLKQNKNQLILDIVHEYVKLLKKHDILLLTQARYALSNQELEEALVKEEVGQLDPVELQLLQSQNLELKVMQKVQHDQLNNAINSFEILTQQPLAYFQQLKEHIDYAHKEVPGLDFFQTQLTQENTELLEKSKEIDIAHKNIALVQAKYKPSLTAQMGYEYTRNFTPIFIGQTSESGAFVGMSTVIPIYTGGRHDAETKRAMMGVRQKERQKEQKESQLLLALQKEYRLYGSIPLEIEAGRQHLKSLKLLNEQIALKNEVGTASALEVAKIDYQYKETQTQLKALEYNYFLADTNVHYLSGTLDVKQLLKFENHLQEQTLSLQNLEAS